MRKYILDKNSQECAEGATQEGGELKMTATDGKRYAKGMLT